MLARELAGKAMHIMEPPDLWQRYIEPEFRDQAPIGLTSDDVRDLRIAHPDGRQWGYNPARDRVRSVRRKNFERAQRIYRYYSEQGWSAKAQLEAMDVKGINVAVLYPTRGLTALAEPHMEPRLAAAIARAYNNWLYNWLYDFCSEAPQRLFGAAMISPFDIEAAVKEARRCARELGHLNGAHERLLRAESGRAGKLSKHPHVKFERLRLSKPDFRKIAVGGV